MRQAGQAPSAGAVLCAARRQRGRNARAAAISELEPSLASSGVAWDLGAETGAGGSACRIGRSGTAARPFQPVPVDMSRVSRVFAQRCPPPATFDELRRRARAKRLAGRFGGEFDAAKLLRGARRQSRCAGALLGAWMGDTGGKSGRRPGRHLQVEASGPGNARPAHWRLVGRFRRGEVMEGCVGGAAGRSKGLICLHVT